MIELKKLTKHYGETVAVDQVSFQVKPKEVLGFLGPNGAGKSTTLKMLSGYLAPTTGSARLAGFDIDADNLDVRRSIGYLPENNPLYDEMDVAEYLEWIGRIRGFSGAGLRSRLRAAVQSCDLGDVLGKKIDFLSKGFRQRVGLAAAILHDPKILLLDEPTSGLDPNQAREVRQLIARLKEEKTVILSTHILSEVEASCDRVVILHRGRIAAEGSPDELTRAAGGVRIHLLVKSQDVSSAEVLAEIKKLDAVAEAHLEGQTAGIALSLSVMDGCADIREDIFKLAVRKKWVLLEMRKASASLENVFSELTLQ